MRQTEDKDRIETKEMCEAIKRSGYPLEQRAKTLLQRCGYSVELNSSYPDPKSGVSREFDIWAAKGRLIFPGTLGTLLAVLVCECMNNPQPVVFFESDYSDQHTWRFCEDIKCSGIPVKFWVAQAYRYLPVYLGFAGFHHCASGPFSTQYCSFQRKKDQVWQAFHDERSHQTFETITHALETCIDLHYGLIKAPEPDLQSPPSIRIYYPVLILQGDLYLARQGRRGVTLGRKQEVQYRREIWTGGRPVVYQVDVITESHIPSFIRMVETEIQQVGQSLGGAKQLFDESVTRIVDDYRENRTGRPPWRTILEYRE
ncbi:MAG: hypothetical protein ABSF45_07095 [Terriglobia bacterium]